MKLRRLVAVAAKRHCSRLAAAAQGGGQLRFLLRSDPKTLDPLWSTTTLERVRYHYGRLPSCASTEFKRKNWNHRTWRTSSELSKDGRTISFNSVKVYISPDGTPFSAEVWFPPCNA